MTTEEKIQHFYKVSVESAQEEAKKELEACRAEQEALLEKYKAEKLQQVELDRKLEKEAIRKQMNKEFSNEQLQIKRRMSRQQNELKTRLFLEVEEKLAAYRKTPEYLDYLCEKCRKDMEFAGNDEIRLLISAGDKNLEVSVEKRIGRPVEISAEDFGGGVRAVITSRNILIDDSFATLLEGEKAEFSFEGRLTHE